MELLDNTFDREDVKRFQSVPLNLSCKRDILAWRFIKNDMYSTKYGYFDGSSGMLP